MDLAVTQVAACNLTSAQENWFWEADDWDCGRRGEGGVAASASEHGKEDGEGRERRGVADCRGCVSLNAGDHREPISSFGATCMRSSEPDGTRPLDSHCGFLLSSHPLTSLDALWPSIN